VLPSSSVGIPTLPPLRPSGSHHWADLLLLCWCPNPVSITATLADSSASAGKTHSRKRLAESFINSHQQRLAGKSLDVWLLGHLISKYNACPRPYVQAANGLQRVKAGLPASTESLSRRPNRPGQAFRIHLATSQSDRPAQLGLRLEAFALQQTVAVGLIPDLARIGHLGLVIWRIRQINPMDFHGSVSRQGKQRQRF
jgi:hypothetical protein